jgi:pyruvate,water dikinase
MASWNILNMQLKGSAIEQGSASPNPLHDLVLQVTRGMPYNPTTEMDLFLWEMAKKIRHDSDSLTVFQNSRTDELSSRFLTRELPPVIMQEVNQFLKRYGGRGLGEIDLGRKRWADEPIYVFEMLASFLKIDDDSNSPDKVFTRGAKSAQQAVDQLAVEVRKLQHGWIKARLVRFMAGRARQLMGVRENPKFFAVRMMWLIQRGIIKTGSEFVLAGDLDQADDLLYLSFSELKEFATHLEKDWRTLIIDRRQTYQRELRRKQIPRLLLSDGRAFYEGVNEKENSSSGLVGSPVSPGTVEGRVRVVLNPSKAGLLPGEILVCPGTDPSWTPLFLSAGGLVMEVGGMMTHGAVVAREYGIPAIVGVGKATTRLHTGQLIRIDGSSGMVFLLDDPIIDSTSQE